MGKKKSLYGKVSMLTLIMKNKSISPNKWTGAMSGLKKIVNIEKGSNKIELIYSKGVIY